MLIIGTANDDILSGGIEDDIIDGFAGRDKIDGGGGSDVISGGAGSDTISGGDGNDFLFAGTIVGNPDGTFTHVDGEIDTVLGGAGNDFIWAGFYDKIDGGDGYDVLFYDFSGAKAAIALPIDVFDKLNRADIRFVEDFVITTSKYADVIDARLYGNTFVQSFIPLTLDTGGGDDYVLGSLVGNRIFAGDGNDRVFLSGGVSGIDNFADGGSGNDTLSSSALFGTLIGGAGNDRLIVLASAGACYIEGGAGDDIFQITNSATTDVTLGYRSAASGVAVDLAISVQANTDTGRDTIIGTINKLEGSAFADVLAGNDNRNEILGLGGSDVIDGRGGDDYLSGDFGDDKINGGAGADFISGGDGNDMLSGNDGDDEIFGTTASTASTVALAMTRFTVARATTRCSAMMAMTFSSAMTGMISCAAETAPIRSAMPLRRAGSRCSSPIRSRKTPAAQASIRSSVSKI